MPVIQLTRGLVTIVDDEDYDALAAFKWHAHPSAPGYFYARREVRRDKKKQGRVYMHRVILGAPAGLLIDHINGDGLDNRRCNLRLATKAENQRNRRVPSTNTSGYKGVTWSRNAGRWHARIRAGDRNVHLGYFDTPEEAHAAYCAVAVKYHGEFARVA